MIVIWDDMSQRRVEEGEVKASVSVCLNDGVK